MGVPAFFRWLSAKYPLILERVVEDGPHRSHCRVRPPEGTSDDAEEEVRVDHLYLDTNGIVHPCAHPEEGPQPRNEEEMFANMGALIDRLVLAVRPQALLYIALDGTAPRAKMNQQRTRRFCSAREMAEAAEARQELKMRHPAAAAEGEAPEPWDHNVITPGTMFMDKLAAFLRAYAAERLERGGEAWKNLAVVISDASVPGEGEHKIVDYIRRWRGSTAYAPDISHAICGQDADLVMLGLALHEPNVLILRERVPTGRKRKGKGPAARKEAADKGLDLLRIETLRQYLRHEFSPLAQPHGLPFPFDLEALLDDFVFLCFFVGNDFLPRMPSLDIREGGLDLLLLLYTRLLPSLGGYLLKDGEVNLNRVKLLVGRVALVEADILVRRTRQDARHGADGAPRTGTSGAVDLKAELEALCLAKNTELAQAAGHAPLRLGEKGWRERYYKDKLGIDDSPATRRDMAAEYVRGLRWVSRYYFQGVPSWHWYYPYHYAPFAIDLKHLDKHESGWDLGTPFTPLTQLMAVLPGRSAHCLPEAYARLMTESTSPILDFYPEDFALDPNGKPPGLRWLWVARLPFIDAARLHAALAAASKTLTAAERRRNSFGGAELLLGSRHPAVRAKVREAAAAAPVGWSPVPAARLAGRVRQLRKLRAGTLEMEYEHPPACHHASVLLPGAVDRSERLTQEVLEASLPRKVPRLPVNEVALKTLLSGHRASGRGGGRGGGGRGNGGRNGGRRGSGQRDGGGGGHENRSDNRRGDKHDGERSGGGRGGRGGGGRGGASGGRNRIRGGRGGGRRSSASGGRNDDRCDGAAGSGLCHTNPVTPGRSAGGDGRGGGRHGVPAHGGNRDSRRRGRGGRSGRSRQLHATKGGRCGGAGAPGPPAH